MKWLICPGLPRSGTTYLFENLVGLPNSSQLNVPRRKEVNWLFRENDEPLSHYYDEVAPEKFTLDISPGYSLNPRLLWDQARELPADGSVKFVIALRHPVAQAFAHYLHDIRMHFSHQWDTGVQHEFLGDHAMRRYFVDRTDVFRCIIQRFGPENVAFLNFHTMFDDIRATEAKLTKLLGIDSLSFSAARVGSGGWMPQFVYGGKIGGSYLFGTKLVEVPARLLLLVNGNESWLRRDVDEVEAARITAGAVSWQRELSHDAVGYLERHVFSDTLSVYSDLLGQSLAPWSPRGLRAEMPSVPDNIGDMCEPVALDRRLQRGRQLTAQLARLEDCAASPACASD